ncbi:MAG: guanylate kinase [Clostridia bacterium]|nr:guanylate kinase [Clostridia bacterium]
MKNKGVLYIISGPSGVGKGTICKALVARRNDLSISVSATTRKPRVEDTEGVTYFFKTVDEFESMIKEDKFLEWAVYNGNYYGTPIEVLNEKLECGQDVILEIEVQGALKVMEKRPDAVTIFLAPPDEKALYERLRARGTETEEQIEKRVKAAEDELKQKGKYQHIVINNVLETAICEVENIMKKAKEKM